jgi:hypothetical protein
MFLVAAERKAGPKEAGDVEAEFFLGGQRGCQVLARLAHRHRDGGDHHRCRAATSN